jgi:hypothetical protein
MNIDSAVHRFSLVKLESFVYFKISGIAFQRYHKLADGYQFNKVEPCQSTSILLLKNAEAELLCCKEKSIAEQWGGALASD